MTTVSRLVARLCAASAINVSAPASGAFDGVTANIGDSIFDPGTKTSWLFQGVGVPMLPDPDFASLPAGTELYIQDGVTMKGTTLIQTAQTSLAWIDQFKLAKDIIANSISLDGGSSFLYGPFGTAPFTPTLAQGSGPIPDITYSGQSGTIFQNGEMVFVQGDLTVVSKGSAANNIIVNAPYPADESTAQRLCGCVWLTGTMSKANQVVGGIELKNGSFRITTQGVGIGGSNLLWGDVSNGIRLNFFFAYKRSLP